MSRAKEWSSEGTRCGLSMAVVQWCWIRASGESALTRGTSVAVLRCHRALWNVERPKGEGVFDHMITWAGREDVGRGLSVQHLWQSADSSHLTWSLTAQMHSASRSATPSLAAMGDRSWRVLPAAPYKKRLALLFLETWCVGISPEPNESLTVVSGADRLSVCFKNVRWVHPWMEASWDEHTSSLRFYHGISLVSSFPSVSFRLSFQGEVCCL